MRYNNHIFKTFFLSVLIALIFSACEYQDIRNASYPDNLIYMPTAKNGVYIINLATTDSVSPATFGSTYQYKIDVPNNQFIIPLGVYLSGVKTQAGFSVSVALNTDTVTSLLSQATYAGYEVLPTTNLKFLNKVDFGKNQQDVTLNLTIDYDYLKANLTKKYLLAVTVSSVDVQTNTKLSTTIISLNLQFLSTATH